MQHHLAIVSPVWIELILDGSKTILYWLHKKRRSAPYGKVNKGDIIYMKENKGRLVHGIFTASEVETFDTITSVEKNDIYEKYGQQMFGRRFSDPEFVNTEWNEKCDSKHATLIHITRPYPFPNPKPLSFKKSDGNAWVVLDKYQVQELRKVKRCYREQVNS